MNMIRRHFIKTIGAATAASLMPAALMARGEVTKLVLLHTNDVHSRIDPFPMDGSRNQGGGGVAQRATVIERIRAEEPHVLLVDAGDMFQGTPYFNVFGGELEIKLMSQLGYDAGTIGNHDFDGGIDGLAKQMVHANFPIINANYQLQNTPLASKVKPYQVLRRGPLRIGLFGLGIELEGLVPRALYGEARYLDPLLVANKIATTLKKDERCDLVICLSHLGYSYKENKVSDQTLADQTRDLDIIIGGHTHTFMPKPEMRRNMDGEPVIINQVGWGGLVLGRLDIFFEKNRKRTCVTCQNTLIT